MTKQERELVGIVSNQFKVDAKDRVIYGTEAQFNDADETVAFAIKHLKEKYKYLTQLTYI